MKNLLDMLSKYSLAGLARRALFTLRGRMVSLRTKEKNRGTALLSFTSLPFTLLDPESLHGHSNYWGAQNIANTFLERGYSVDVIDFDNSDFVPKKQYAYFVDIGANMGRIAPLLSKTCTKIFYATGADWAFQNDAEQARIRALSELSGVTLLPRRQVAPMYGIEHADIISGVCGAFPASTYEHYGKPIHMTTVTTTHTYPFPEDRNSSEAKNNFVWFGGAGAVHKGLDLVLEAFALMPEYTLTVCGKFNAETDFQDLYAKELYSTPNIHTVGYIDPSSEKFKSIMDTSIAVISASCSEGCATSVVLAMGAGLIPIVNKETGVDVGDFGYLLANSTVHDIQVAVRDLANTAPAALKLKAKKAWGYVYERHGRPRVEKEFRAIIDELEQLRKASKQAT